MIISSQVDDFNNLIRESVQSFNLKRKDCKLDFEKVANITRDYRCNLPMIKNNCQTVYFKDNDNILGVVTLIFVDEKVSNELFFAYKTCDESVSKIPVNKVITSPFVEIGYAEFFIKGIKKKYAAVKWIIELVNEMMNKLDLGACLQIMGTQDPEMALDSANVGTIRSESKTVINLANMLHMNKLDNIYEEHTLGPVFFVYGKNSNRQTW